MLRSLTVLVFCLFLSFVSFSQTKKEAVKELIIVMKQDSLMDKMFDAILPTMGVSIDALSNKGSKEYLEKMAPMMKILKGIMKKFVDEDMVNMYDKIFTEKEIKDYITFYKTPSGQKFIAATPEIQKETMQIMMSKYMPEMMKAIKDVKE
jgi:uncharacterized protein